eukprot:COSAG04_NODE_1510_length_6492_cov_11.980291_3_plen_63_part_00
MSASWVIETWKALPVMNSLSVMVMASSWTSGATPSPCAACCGTSGTSATGWDDMSLGSAVNP